MATQCVKEMMNRGKGWDEGMGAVEFGFDDCRDIEVIVGRVVGDISRSVEDGKV